MSQVRRRQLLVAAGAILATPLAGVAQQSAKVARIGFLSSFTPSVAAPWDQAFRKGLRNLGWVEGKDISIEYRYADGRTDRLPDLAADLVRLKVDIIVTSVTTDALAAQKATKVIPIVMATAGDPVAIGLVESLSRPGGNITGMSQLSAELVGKRLELLKEIVPTLSRVAVLWNPQNVGSTQNWKVIQRPARQLGIQLYSMEARSPNDFDKAFEDAIRARAGALLLLGNPLFVENLKRIADLAARARLPSIFGFKEFVDAGGLAAYGPDRSDLFRRAAAYVDKILKGAKPAGLPVQQPTKFELVINMRAAKALGVTIPKSMLVRADEVIE